MIFWYNLFIYLFILPSKNQNKDGPVKQKQKNKHFFSKQNFKNFFNELNIIFQWLRNPMLLYLISDV